MQFKKLGLNETELLVLEKQLGKYDKKTRKQFLRMNEFPVLTIEQIIELENQIGFTLPQDYKEFLHKYNGGYPSEQGFSNGKVLNYFYGYFPNLNTQFSLEHDSFSNRFPQGTLAIGMAGGGDRILLGLKNQLFGKIYYWQHDWETDDEDIENSIKPNNYFDNVTLIAHSFNEFLDSLYE